MQMLGVLCFRLLNGNSSLAPPLNAVKARHLTPPLNAVKARQHHVSSPESRSSSPNNSMTMPIIEEEGEGQGPPAGVMSPLGGGR